MIVSFPTPLKIEDAEHVVIECPPLGYPVGNDIRDAIKYAEAAAEAFISLGFGVNKINIWCRGSSGAILSALLTQALMVAGAHNSVRINHIKKPGEESHSGNSFWVYKGDINIIIDDFIQYGSTLNKIYEAYTENLPDELEGNPIDVLIIQNGDQDHLRRLNFVPSIIISRDKF